MDWMTSAMAIRHSIAWLICPTQRHSQPSPLLAEEWQPKPPWMCLMTLAEMKAYFPISLTHHHLHSPNSSGTTNLNPEQLDSANPHHYCQKTV